MLWNPKTVEVTNMSLTNERKPARQNIKFTCTLARIVLLLMFVLLLAPIAITLYMALYPTPGVTVELTKGIGGVAEGILFAGMTAVAMFIGQNLLGRVSRTGDPFRAENARDLKLISFLVLGAGIASAPFGILVAHLLDGAYIGTMVNIPATACGCLILATSKVFEYGCILQQQDDGTI